MDSFALAAEEAKQFHGVGARARAPVRDARVEFGDFAGAQDDFSIAEREPEPSTQDVDPLVAVVHALLEFLRARTSGNDRLVCLQAAGVPRQRYERHPVFDERLLRDARIANVRGVDEVVECDVVRAHEREKKLECRLALAGFEPRNGTARNRRQLRRLCERQRTAQPGVFESWAHRFEQFRVFVHHIQFAISARKFAIVSIEAHVTCMEISCDVLIVGGGPAGLSAGLMLARARRRVTLVDGGQPRNRFATHMHGVLGHDGKSPRTLTAEGRREVESYGGEVVDATIASVKRSAKSFAVTTDAGTTYHARRLIVATGLRDELPAIAGLAEQWGTGVVVCPYCDGYEVRDTHIGVIGSSPLSVHQAQMLRQWSDRVTYFPCDVGLPQAEDLRALAARGVAVEPSAVVRVVATDAGALVGVDLADGRRVALDKVFVGPRPVPLDDLLQALGAARADNVFGSFVTTDPTGKTSVDGVWAAGNVTSPVVNVPMAMGAGSFAAAAVNADLINEEIADAVRATGDAIPV